MKNEKKDIKNVNDNTEGLKIPDGAEVVELDPEALEALMGGGVPVAQSFNYTLLDSFEMEDIDERRLYINDVINDEVITTIGYHILRYNRLDKGIDVKERKPIMLYLNTVGGSLFAGNSLISLIKSSKTPVYTVNLGVCLSMGFLIFLAGKKKYALDNSIFLLHDGANGGMDSTAKLVDRIEFEKNVIEKKIKEYVLENTAITSKSYDKNYRKEWYMDVDKAKELEIVDYIIGEDCDIDEILN